MALHSGLRVAEVLGRNVDRPLAHAVPKPAAGLPQAGVLLGTAPDTTSPGSRDSSPDSRGLSQRGVTLSSDQLDDTLPGLEGTPARFTPSGQAPTPSAPAVNLDACPSFAEQRPERTKPVFLERHGTLQHAHQTVVLGRSTHHGVDGDGGSAPPTPSNPPTPNTSASYLPGWEIARSGIWQLVDAALQRTDALRASRGAADTAPDTASLSQGTRQTPSADHQAVQPPPARLPPPPLSPFARLQVQSSMISTPLPPLPGTHATAATQPPHPDGRDQDQEQDHAATQAPGPLPRLLQRGMSVGRPCPFTPRGMGPLELSLPWLPLAPSSSFSCRGAARASPRHGSAAPHHRLAASGGAGAGLSEFASDGAAAPPHWAATADSDGPASLEHHAATRATGVPPAGRDAHSGPGCDVPQDHRSCYHQPEQQEEEEAEAQRVERVGECGHQHVAFAAGLAAGTSTAAALRHAGAAAAAGLAAVASSVHTTSVAVQLGANALNAGTDVLLSRYQGALIKKATSVVADKVLGPAASPSLRLALRQRLRATVAGASVLWFLVNTSAMGDTLMHMGLDHDVVTSAKMVLHLASSAPGFMENCRELLQVGVAVGVGVAQRNAARAQMERSVECRKE